MKDGLLLDLLQVALANFANLQAVRVIFHFIGQQLFETKISGSED